MQWDIGGRQRKRPSEHAQKTGTSNQIIAWKKKLLEQSSAIFERKNKKDEEYTQMKKEKEELFRQLGEMRYENEWLKKKYKQLYGKDPG
jgi:transposase-like protein